MAADKSELDWIVRKAYELLEDKVKDGPLTDGDVKLAFEIFAQPRLRKLFEGQAEVEHKRAADYVMMELQERARQLNLKRWRKG